MDKRTEQFISKIDKIVILDEKETLVLTTSDIMVPFENNEFIEYLNEQHYDKRMVFEKCEVLHMNSEDKD